MAARETFEWFVGTQAELTPAQEAFVREQRQYLFTLRSEDERQRFVEWAMTEIARMGREEGSAKLPKSHAVRL